MAGERDQALDTLAGLFRRIGTANNPQPPEGGDAISGMLGQVEEFVSMPMDLAVIFLNMSVELAELVLTALEEAGFTLVKGMTPL
jgi:hypothetical protein